MPERAARARSAVTSRQRGRSASGEPPPVDRASTRDTLPGIRRTGRCFGSTDSLAAGAAPTGGSSRRLPNRWTPGMCTGWWTPRPAWAASWRISARRAQASAIVTRRAETGPAGSVRRSRIERDPKGDAHQVGPDVFRRQPDLGKDTDDQTARPTPSGGSLAAWQGSGGSRGWRGCAARHARCRKARTPRPFPAGSVGPPSPRQGFAPGAAGRPGVP